MKIIKRAIDQKIETAFNILDYSSRTPLGIYVRELRKNPNGHKKIDRSVLVALDDFYENRFESFCATQGWECFDMLIYRNRELKNQYAYLSNFYLAIFTGLLATAVYEYYPRLLSVLSQQDLSFVSIALKILISIGICLFSLASPFLILIVFRKCIMLTPPALQYYEEYEMKIIEKKLEKMSVV